MHRSREVALVPILAAEMGEPQEAQPEPHEKSQPAEHHLSQESQNRSLFHSGKRRALRQVATLGKALGACNSSLQF
jgi:hypothetical protein